MIGDRRPTAELGDPTVISAVGALVLAAAELPMDRLADVEDLAAHLVGARTGCIYVADYAQQRLQRLRHTSPQGAIDVDATIHGRVFQTGEAHLGDGRVIVALAEGNDRLGVVEYDFGADVTPSLPLAEAIGNGLLLVLVSRRRYTDLVLRAAGRQPLSIAAEMQWDLLPPLACAAGGIASRGMLEPAYSIGGDSFDYALNPSSSSSRSSMPSVTACRRCS